MAARKCNKKCILQSSTKHCSTTVTILTGHHGYLDSRYEVEHKSAICAKLCKLAKFCLNFLGFGQGNKEPFIGIWRDRFGIYLICTHLFDGWKRHGASFPQSVARKSKLLFLPMLAESKTLSTHTNSQCPFFGVFIDNIDISPQNMTKTCWTAVAF